MIENQIRNNAATLNPAQFAGTSAKSGNTTAFESLLSALATEARSAPLPTAGAGREPQRSEVAAATRARVSESAREHRSDVAAARRGEIGRTERLDRPERPERPEKAQRPERPGRVERNDRPEKPERVDNKDEVKDDKSTEVQDGKATDEAGKTDETVKSDEAAAKASGDQAASEAAAKEAAEIAQGALVSDSETVATKTAGATAGVEETAKAKGATTTKPLGIAEVPVDAATQEALRGETPAAEKGPALDGETLMQDMKNPETKTGGVLSETAKPISNLPTLGIDSVRVATPATAPEDNPVAQVVAMAVGQGVPSVAKASAGTGSNAGVSGVSGTSNAVPLAAAPPAPAAPASAPVSQAAPTYAPNLSQQVFDQLQNHLTRLRPLGEGMHQLKLAINPETFGPVRVAVHFQADGTVQMQLLGANDAARDQLRQVMADLRRDLASTGLTAQLDLAQSDQEFAQFTGAGAETGHEMGQGGTPAGSGGQDVSRSDTTQDERKGMTAPQVGDVLKDGADGSVDMFA